MASDRYRADQVIGFLTPLGIFLEAGSPIYLATSPLAQEDFSFPISIIALPFAIFISISRKQRRVNFNNPVAFFAGFFSIYALATSAAYSVLYRPTAILYGIQWCTLFIWFFYFNSLESAQKFFAFVRAFCAGTIFTIFYYLIAGLIEYFTYGGLQDGGRMSQNLIFPGQYQIAVYLPTLVSYTLILLNIFTKTKIFNISKYFLAVINIAGAISLLFFAAREAILVVACYIFLTMIADRGPKRFLALLGAGVLVLIILNASAVTAMLEGSQFRLVEKLATLDESDNYLGGRDTMVADVMDVIRINPLFGTYFLPPNSGIISSTINAPSAHNMYVDAFAWAGILGGLLYCTVCLLLLRLALRRIFNSFGALEGDYLGRHCAILLIVMLFVSNNLNVPMRQPVISPMLAMMIFICSYWWSAPEKVSIYAKD